MKRDTVINYQILAFCSCLEPLGLCEGDTNEDKRPRDRKMLESCSQIVRMMLGNKKEDTNSDNT